jgi:hypothetical protein
MCKDIQGCNYKKVINTVTAINKREKTINNIETIHKATTRDYGEMIHKARTRDYGEIIHKAPTRVYGE